MDKKTKGRRGGRRGSSGAVPEAKSTLTPEPAPGAPAEAANQTTGTDAAIRQEIWFVHFCGPVGQCAGARVEAAEAGDQQKEANQQ
jgi:hypothetical protein